MLEKRHELTAALFGAYRLPGRVASDQAAKLLGFARHDISVLVASGLLCPLGNPAQNSAKFFAATELLNHATDSAWLNRATKAVSAHWKVKNRQKRSEQKISCSKGGEKVDPRENPGGGSENI